LIHMEIFGSSFHTVVTEIRCELSRPSHRKECDRICSVLLE